ARVRVNAPLGFPVPGLTLPSSGFLRFIAPVFNAPGPPWIVAHDQASGEDIPVMDHDPFHGSLVLGAVTDSDGVGWPAISLRADTGQSFQLDQGTASAAGTASAWTFFDYGLGYVHVLCDDTWNYQFSQGWDSKDGTKWAIGYNNINSNTGTVH